LPLARRRTLSPRPRARIAKARGHTAANLVYQALRDDIVAMRIAPGQPINEKSVALDHGVSRTPVREALLQLAGEHLVDIFPQSGTFVTRIPLAALPEAILVRKALEDLTVRRAAEDADAAVVAGLRQIVDRQQKLERRGDRDGFHAADDGFHAAIADAGGHPGIWRLIEKVKIQVDRYRRLTLPMPGRMGRVVDEHAAVVAAIAAGDPDQAAAAMATHLDGLNASIGDIRDLNPEFFDIPIERPPR
jgi:GntR family transcriptional regulator, rspAB operon transcriptional repressor